MDRRGRYSRGYLPHIDVSGKSQFITWNLADALPASVMEELDGQLARMAPEKRVRQRWSRIEKLLDKGYGSQMLRQPLLAREVQRAIFAGHQTEYVLHAYTVMPTHVHVLCTPIDPHSLAFVTQRLKGRSSRWVNQARKGRGSIWHVESFDRYTRDEGHFLRVLRYIEYNAVKARLCQDPRLWTYSSANPDNWNRLGRLSD